MERDTADVVAGVQAAFRAIVAALPRSVRSAAEFRRVLGIDNKLASQVYKIAHATDPVRAAVLVPGAPSFERLMNAAAALGLARPLLTDAADAIARFDQLVRRHAGDRTTFDSMLIGLTGPDNEPLELQHRRAAFRAMGHILGVQARLLTYCSVLYPATPRTEGLSTLRGLYGLRRIRPDTPVMLGTPYIVGHGVGRGLRRPLDTSRPENNPAGLVAHLCPSPLPALHTRTLADGGVLTEFVEGGVGDLHTADFVLGFDYPSFGEHFPDRAYDTNAVLFMADVHIPAEELVHDILVHRGVRRLNAVARVHPNRGGIRPMYDADQAEVIPTRVELEVIDRADAAYAHASPAEHSTAVNWLIAQRGESLADYVLYRARLRYPVVNTVVRMRLS